MLVLTRRMGETIVIDGNISITVVAIQGDRIRLGVTAPKDTVVDRLEVHLERTKEQDGRTNPAEKPVSAPSPIIIHPCKV